MRNILILVLLCIPVSAFAWGDEDVQVDGYTRDGGTYVQPHMRTAPDNNTSNNYSTYGNTNPYTGQQGSQYKSGPSGYDFNRSESGHLGGMDSGRQSYNPAMRTR